MPSGFQQDQNQLSPSFFRVVINLTGYPSEASAAGSNTNGGVTPNSADSFSTVNLPTTLAFGKARARGNMRFRNVVNRLTNVADCHVLDVEITEANGNAQATSLSFTVRYERGSFVPNAGTNVNGGNITTQAGFLEDVVARGILDETTSTVRVYNGDDFSDGQTSITVAAPDTVANVLADVAVNLIDGTELVSSI